MGETAKTRLQDAPVSCQGILERAYEGKASPRAAIKAFCLQCVGYQRQDVTECSAQAYPLWRYRPYQRGED